jgi:hypothetical protein
MNHAGKLVIRGARNLIFAIIMRAVEDTIASDDGIPPARGQYWKASKEAEIRQNRKDAEEWLASREDGFMSFEWYCNLIGLDPGYFRKNMMDD